MGRRSVHSASSQNAITPLRKIYPSSLGFPIHFSDLSDSPSFRHHRPDGGASLD